MDMSGNHVFGALLLFELVNKTKSLIKCCFDLKQYLGSYSARVNSSVYTEKRVNCLKNKAEKKITLAEHQIFHLHDLDPYTNSINLIASLLPIVFCGHPSLRFGDAVHFIEMWGSNPNNSINLQNLTSHIFKCWFLSNPCP